MATTPVFIVNSPASGVHYAAPAGYWFIPNNASNVTYHVEAWSGPNGTGSPVQVTDFLLINRNASTNTEVSTLVINAANSGGFNPSSGSYITSLGHNGSDKFTASAKFDIGAVGSLKLWADYTGAAVIPSVSGFSPPTGGPGSTVTISGSNFTGATAVRFNGVSATFSVTNDTTISATVPSGATAGPISVSNPSGTGTSASNFQPGQFYWGDGSTVHNAVAIWYGDPSGNGVPHLSLGVWVPMNPDGTGGVRRIF
jgi:hypothetical protein